MPIRILNKAFIEIKSSIIFSRIFCMVINMRLRSYYYHTIIIRCIFNGKVI